MNHDDTTSFAIFPLTPFDHIFERSSFVTGWLVEGSLDLDRLRFALDSVTEKWRMLAGRLEIVKDEKTTKCHLRIPLGSLDAGYRRYSLTSIASDLPVSNFIPLPLPFHSPSLPPSFFVDAQLPRQYSTYVGQPLTWWHVTSFPAEADGTVYSCVGFARCHGIFDGIGAAAIMRAVVAEMNGTSWDVPPLPSPGLTENPVLQALEPRLEVRAAKELDIQTNSGGLVPVKGGRLLWLAGWQLREKWWRGAAREIFILPKRVTEGLVNDTRKPLDGSSKVSTGDVLVAWLMKTTYAATVPSTVVHCSNIASFRSMFPGSDLQHYAHNAWSPVPYPLLSAKDIQLLPLHELCRRMAMARLSMDMYDVIAAYKTLQSFPLSMPGHPEAHESLVVSNVSASKIMETDWSVIGGVKTVCSYRYSLTPTNLLLSNVAYISGRLADGSVVLDVTLSSAKLELLVAEVDRLLRLRPASSSDQ